jgi:hypothetical protein
LLLLFDFDYLDSLNWQRLGLISNTTLSQLAAKRLIVKSIETTAALGEIGFQDCHCVNLQNVFVHQ